jgi:hypothetical protein
MRWLTLLKNQSQGQCIAARQLAPALPTSSIHGLVTLLQHRLNQNTL